MQAIRQLVVIDYTPYSDATHLLVRSSAPNNAEDGSLKLPLPSKEGNLDDKTDEALRELRRSLARFLQTFQSSHQNSEDFLNALHNRLKIVMNIHGYSTPLPNFHRNAFLTTKQKLDRDRAKRAASGQSYGDYVVFIDYSWPSEQIFSLSPCSVLRATPFLLRLLLLLALALGLSACLRFLSPSGALWAPILLGWLGGLLLGIGVALLLLRMVTYFRDRDRAASAAVYDGVELVRWLHQIFLEEITTAAPRIDRVEQLRALLEEEAATQERSAGSTSAPVRIAVELSLLAHSMGCFVATQLVRTLSDVFDPQAVDRWKRVGPEGPFSMVDPCGEAMAFTSDRSIGELFTLGQLVLCSPDIPVWALTNGRSNPLQACLRRFEQVYLFTNDADIVLRLISTLANFFVFPSGTRKGGYRLGNVVPLEGPGFWGKHALDLNHIGLFGMGATRLNRALALTEAPFFARRVLASRLTLVDCTNYCDLPLTGKKRRWGPRMASQGPGWRPLRYLFTLLFSMLGRIHPHGGYFRGSFCLDLIYQLLLSGSTRLNEVYPVFSQDLQRHRINWVDVQNPPNC